MTKKTKATDTAGVPFAVPDWPAAQKPEMVKVAAISAHPKNPRTHPDIQIDNLGAAYDEFGVAVPLIVDEKYRLIAGAGRWMAAQKHASSRCCFGIATSWSMRRRPRGARRLRWRPSRRRWASAPRYS